MAHTWRARGYLHRQLSRPKPTGPISQGPPWAELIPAFIGPHTRPCDPEQAPELSNLRDAIYRKGPDKFINGAAEIE